MNVGVVTTALRLGILAAMVVGSVVILAHALAPRIATNVRAALLDDFRSLTGLALGDEDVPDAIGAGFEICRDDVALSVLIAEARGYGGPIELAIARDTTYVRGVRVLKHAETPGIGDIVVRDDGQWIARFRGQPVARPNDWAVDTVTGATITTRAVISAVAASVGDASLRPCAS